MQEIFRHNLTYIGRWCNEAVVLVNPTTGYNIWFFLNNYIVNTPTSTVNKCLEIVKRTHKMKHLGALFDWRLALTEHLSQVKIRKGLTAIKVM